MVVYILMYRHKSGSFGPLDVFYTLKDALEYRDKCIEIDKINHTENEYKIQSIRIEKEEK